MSDQGVQFAPFEIHRKTGTVWVGRDGGRSWITLDSIGAAVLSRLDEGDSIDEVSATARSRYGAALDVRDFVAELRLLGFVTTGPAHQGSALLRPEPRVQTKRATWCSRTFTCAAALGGAYALLSLLVGAVPVPSGASLFSKALPLGWAIALAIMIAMASGALHELAHYTVARSYGLQPRVRLSRRGPWLVAQTEMPGIWSLPLSLQLRAVTAGTEVDLILLGACAAVIRTVPAAEPIGATVALTAFAVIFLRILWQLQWNLRTDGYFLLTLAACSPNLRDSAHRWTRERLGALRLAPVRDTTTVVLPSREARFAVAYALSLPFAFSASAAFSGWVVLTAVLGLRDLLGGVL